MIMFPTSRRQIKCLRSRPHRGREQEQPKQIRPSGEKLLILQVLLNLKMFESWLLTCLLYVKPTWQRLKIQPCRSYRVLFWVDSWVRQMSEVHCTFSAANVAVRESRHELMLLATEHRYWLLPSGHRKLPTPLRETNKTSLIILMN